MENEKEMQEELTQDIPVEAAEEVTPEEVSSETVEETAETAAEETAVPAGPEKKATPGKIALAVGAVVVLAAVLVALLVTGFGGKEEQTGESLPAETAAVETVPATVPADGNPDDVTCKGTYTVSDEEAVSAKNVVVAAVGEDQLTNGQLQVYYWSIVNNYLNSESGYYAMRDGSLDYTRPLDTQWSTEEVGLTWQQYFLKEAINFWQLYVSLAEEAKAEGLELSQEDQAYLNDIEASLEQSAASYGVTVEELMRNNFGPGAGVEEYKVFQQRMLEGREYYENALAAMQPTQEDLEDFYTRNEEIFAANEITKEEKLVNARHILIGPDGGTADENGVVSYSEEEWAACEAEAQSILDEFLSGDKTEDSFAVMATEKTEDGGSRNTGGLYEGIYKGQMVKPFEDWCFDDSRAYGDTGLVKTDYGYHIMYFVSSEPMWTLYAESGWVTEQSNAFLMDLAEKYPVENAAYEKMVLGYNAMGSN